VPKDALVAVIDDDEPFRVALVESLCSLEYNARGYESAEEFLGGGGGSSCDCVITDIHMPGMSGIALKRQLLNDGFKVPVIMITAHADPGLDARALASGAVCLLRKPFESSVLVDCLERALNP
jgi:FixJ family two-component response regulator